MKNGNTGRRDDQGAGAPSPNPEVPITQGDGDRTSINGSDRKAPSTGSSLESTTRAPSAMEGESGRAPSPSPSDAGEQHET